MAATAHPAPPSAVLWENGAVQGAIRRGGTAEVKLKKEAIRKETAKKEQEVAQATQEGTDASKAEDDGSRPRSTSNADSVVDVSLDSPAQENGQLHFDEAVLNSDNIVNGDVIKTPTPTRAMSPEQAESGPVDGDRKGKGRARSAAATWSAIIGSVVDHTDEHTTK